MEELRKCPFCGGEAMLEMEFKKDIDWAIFCECTLCGAKTKYCYPNLLKAREALRNVETCKEEAIEAWNRRVE